MDRTVMIKLGVSEKKHEIPVCARAQERKSACALIIRLLYIYIYILRARSEKAAAADAAKLRSRHNEIMTIREAD